MTTFSKNRFLYFAIWPVLSIIIFAQSVFVPLSLSIYWTVVWGVITLRILKKQTLAVHFYWQMAFLLLGFTLIFVQFGRLWGVEPGVAFLTTGLLAKCLESKTPRDLIVVFNFGLFVTASLFLHSQAIWLTVLVFVGLVFGFIGLFRIQTVDFVATGMVKQSLKQDAQHVLKSVAIAIPFFILLFMFFPRLPPVWSLPIPENQAVTGISDQMSPGDIAQISQSTALAFRVVDNTAALPPRSELYWRAMVLDNYDGTTWTSNIINQTSEPVLAEQYQGFTYRYIPAKAGQKWVMSLEHSFPTTPDYTWYRDGRIEPIKLTQNITPIHLFWFDTKQKIRADQSQNLAPIEQRINTAFESSRDPQAQALAQRLWLQSSRDPARYMQIVLQWYRQNAFVYTLAPGVLSGNRTDQFLFKTRQGFCEHYASSFVLLMRYVGIPARVVVGYQGGQLAPDGQSWEVRQLDAHAWSEVWLNGQWQRVDPTAIIAPRRIDQGMQNFAGQNSAIWGNRSALGVQSYEWLKTARIWSDYLSYQWQSKVVGYDVDQQKNWLQKIGLHGNYAGVMVIVGCFVVLGLGFILLYVLKRHYRTPAFDRALNRFNRRLPLNLRRKSGQTLHDWMRELSLNNPKPCFLQVADLYALVHYAEHIEAHQLKLFKRLLKDCANALKSVG